MTRIYAGIGSRVTPRLECALMVETARLLCARGWTLRTGGAERADTAFLSGCLLWEPALFELYLPWPGFSNQAPATLAEPTERALEIAERYHPAWPLLPNSVRNLMGRNVHQVLGADCKTPVGMIVCWTPVPSVTGVERGVGGTGMALRVAEGESPGLEVINLVIPSHWNRIARFADPSGLEFPLREDYTQEKLPL